MSRKRKDSAASAAGSWRQIRQTAKQKAVTVHARQRMARSLFRAVCAGVLLAVLGTGIFFAVRNWREGVERISTMMPPQPLREIIFETDGVLTRRWVEGVLRLPENVDLAEIDIHEKKELLESYGQIESASLRRLPDKLEIKVRERRPVVRIAVRNPEGKPVAMVVDRNGVVYTGINYDRNELRTLPFLAGVDLRQQGDGFRRLQGVDQVDELLRAAHRYSPQLVRSWKVVDCGELPLIKVRSDEIREIVFGPEQRQQQLQRLDMIIHNNRRQFLKLDERVDLSLGNQVVVY